MIEIIKAEMKRIGLMIILAVAISLIMIIAAKDSYSSFQQMDNLDYNVTLNDDGSIKIVETWDVYLYHTNTLFKNFNKSSKFGEIADVSVVDLKTGKKLEQINEEMYHVTTDCFYALDIKDNMFEIAWGTGMEKSKGKKKYQITYTVTDAATSYKDCQELYWMLLSKSNAIQVKKVTGTITLPMNVSNIENLKVWGHGPLNGNIERVSTNTVKFDVDNLSSGRMLEIRIVTPEHIMESISESKTNNYNHYNEILSEEKRWADEADKKADDWKGDILVVIGIGGIIILFQIFRIIKYYRLYKKQGDGIKRNQLKYYRDIPRDGKSTPMEAEYLYYFNKTLDRGRGKSQSDAVAATILNLTLKKYISLRYEEKNIYIKILKDDDGLKDDEKAIYRLLKSTGKKKEFEIGDINKYAKKNYYEYSGIINRMVNSARESLYKEKLVDKAQKELYSKSKRADAWYITATGFIEFLIAFYIVSVFPLFNRYNMLTFGMGFETVFLKIILAITPFIVVSAIKNKILSKTQTRIAVVTQEGYNEKQQWQALARFMKEYSMLEDATTPSLAIWEKYLVFATAFGIADEVIKEMKAKYPEVFVEEYWEDEKKNEYPVLNFSLYSGIYSNDTYTSPISSISRTANTAYQTSAREISAHSSSSSGGGGGFSGGGGGRRRRWPEWAEDKRRIKNG